MAIVNQIASGRWVADAATVWSTGVVPAAGDQVFALSALDLTVDDDTNVLFSFELSTSNTLTIDATKTLEATSYVILGHSGGTGGTGAIACGGNFGIGAGHTFTGNVNIEMTGTGTITDDSASPGGANLEINTAGTVTLATDAYCVDFTLTAGTIVGTGYEVTATGDVLYVAGTATGLSLVMLGSGKSLGWNAEDDELTELTITGTITATALVWLKKLSGTGSLILNSSIVFNNITSSGWWDFTGTVTEGVAGRKIVQRTSESPGTTPIDIDVQLDIQLDDETTSFETDLSAPSLIVRSQTAANLATLEMCNCTRLSIEGEVALGDDDSTGSGSIIISGMASMGSLVDGNAANTANAFSFGAGCHVEFSGLGDFANIAVTASTNMPPEIVCGETGQVTNCEPDNEIALFGLIANDTPGTNNLNITNFVNTESYPGSLMTMGIGGGRLLVPFLLMAMVISYMMMKGMC